MSRLVPLIVASLLVVTTGAARADLARLRPTTLDRCDALVRDHPEKHDAYRCYAVVASAAQQWDDAVRRIEALLSVRPGDHKAELSLAFLEAHRGGARAETLYRRAADGFSADRDAEGEVYARSGLAHWLQWRGRVAESVPEVERTVKVAEASGNPSLLPWAWCEQGWLAYYQGDYARALVMQRKAGAGVLPDGQLELRSSILSGLGAALWATGRIAESLETYRRQADLVERAADRYEEATARYNVALLAGRLSAEGKFTWDDVLEYQRRALDASIAGRNRSTEGATRLLMAQNPRLSLAGKLGQAEAALALAREAGRFQNMCFAMRLVAGLRGESEPGDAPGAFRLLDEAIELARSRGSLPDLARGLISRGGMRWGRRQREQAIADLTVAVDTIERMRNLQRDDLVRARFFSEWTFAYHRLCGYLLDPPGTPPSDEDMDRAFRVAERMRSRALLDALDAAGASAFVPLDPAVRRPRDEVLQRIIAAQKRLMDPGLVPGDRESVLEEIDRLEILEADLRDEISRASPPYRALRDPEFPSLDEVRQALAGDQAVLAFLLSTRAINERKLYYQGGSWVFVVTRDAAKVLPLPDADEVKDAVSVYLGLLERRDDLERRAGARLYDDLLRDALRELPPTVTRLVVVPDGALNVLPLDALRPDPASEPLASRYEIVLTPSATAWVRWRKTPFREADRGALALADPAVGGEAAVLRQAAPWSEAIRLGPLPRAREEGRDLVDRLGRDGVLRAGEEASERYLKHADVRQFSILHLAAHAVADDERPARSAVLLAPGAPTEDGLLQLREVVGLDLGGSVVILSACGTASGELIRGEGVLGLGRAFLQAGARAVIGSLWPLRDDEAAVFVGRIARHLAHGESVGAAMAAARRDRIAAGDPVSAWAGMVVLGDGDVIPARQGSHGAAVDWRRPALLLALALLAAGFGVLLYRWGRSL